MHYTEASGRVIIDIGGTDRQLTADQNLPSVIGTTAASPHYNAHTMEIINVIERAGLTLAASPAADLSAGYIQLMTAIFDSAAIGTSSLTDLAVTDAKVNDVGLAKLTDGKCIISEAQGGSITYSLTIDSSPVSTPPEIELAKSDASGSPVTVETTEINVDDGFYNRYVEDGVVTKKVLLNYDGAEFKNSVKKMRHTSVDFSSASWTDLSATVTTTIPATAIVLMAQFSYKSGSIWGILPAQFGTEDHLIVFTVNGGFLDATISAFAQITSTTYDEIWMTVMWSES